MRSRAFPPSPSRNPGMDPPSSPPPPGCRRGRGRVRQFISVPCFSAPEGSVAASYQLSAAGANKEGEVERGFWRRRAREGLLVCKRAENFGAQTSRTFNSAIGTAGFWCYWHLSCLNNGDFWILPSLGTALLCGLGAPYGEHTMDMGQVKKMKCFDLDYVIQNGVCSSPFPSCPQCYSNRTEEALRSEELVEFVVRVLEAGPPSASCRGICPVKCRRLATDSPQKDRSLVHEEEEKCLQVLKHGCWFMEARRCCPLFTPYSGLYVTEHRPDHAVAPKAERNAIGAYVCTEHAA